MPATIQASPLISTRSTDPVPIGLLYIGLQQAALQSFFRSSFLPRIDPSWSLHVSIVPFTQQEINQGEGEALCVPKVSVSAVLFPNLQESKALI